MKDRIANRIVAFRSLKAAEVYGLFVLRFVADMNIVSGRARFGIRMDGNEYVLLADDSDVGQFAPVWAEHGANPLVGALAILTDEHPEPPAEVRDDETDGPNVFDPKPESVHRAVAFCLSRPTLAAA